MLYQKYMGKDIHTVLHCFTAVKYLFATHFKFQDKAYYRVQYCKSFVLTADKLKENPEITEFDTISIFKLNNSIYRQKGE